MLISRYTSKDLATANLEISTLYDGFISGVFHATFICCSDDDHLVCVYTESDIFKLGYLYKADKSNFTYRRATVEITLQNE